MKIENPLEYARLAIDNDIINEQWDDPIPWLDILNALDKAITGQRLTITDVYFAIKGLIYAIHTFPFAESIWIGPHHFIKSETRIFSQFYQSEQFGEYRVVRQ